ncbi:MAG TPA: hypothetical protein VKE95_03540 [Burkholderiales bacterium]|nr:hypothetical protein [Burkholderiales bacterium]
MVLLSGEALAQSQWEKIESVLTHPRCINCHTVTAFPTQGDDRHRHQFGVARGEDNKGAGGLRCPACHQEKNQENGIPGAPGWHLAPRSMGWEAAPGVAMKGPRLCRTLLDRTKNGGMTAAQMEGHFETEPLVLWAWNPGSDLQGRRREPPPVPHAEFMQAVREWLRARAPCPKG